MPDRADVAAWAARSRQRHRVVNGAFVLAEQDRGASGALLAAALAARIFLWSLPCALLLIALLGFLGGHRSTLNRLAEEFGLSASARAQIVAGAGQVVHSRFLTAMFGAVLFVVAGIALGRAMDGVVELLWGVPRRRGLTAQLRRAVRYSAALAGIFVVNLAGVALRTALIPGILVSAAVFALFVGFGSVLLAVDGVPPGRRTLPGSLLLAMGLEAMRLVGFYYLPDKLERSSALYGAFGIAAALLLWFTIIGRLIVLGHVLNAGQAHRSADGVPP
jgi:membrane protein